MVNFKNIAYISFFIMVVIASRQPPKGGLMYMEDDWGQTTPVDTSCRDVSFSNDSDVKIWGKVYKSEDFLTIKYKLKILKVISTSKT